MRSIIELVITFLVTAVVLYYLICGFRIGFKI